MSDGVLTAEEQIRFESLQGDLETLRESADESIPIPDLSDDFLRLLVRQGSAFATLPKTFLARCKLELRSPDELDEHELTAELWKTIWVMALLRMFLEQTDHLSDRELYGFLYDTALAEPTAFMPGEENPPFYTIDPLWGCSREDNRLLLTYYSDRIDSELRDDLAAEFQDPIAPLPRPYDRDRMLP